MLAFEGSIVSKKQLLDHLKFVLSDCKSHLFETERYSVRSSLENFSCDQNDYKNYEKLFNIPLSLAILENQIFIYLPMPHRQKWPIKFITAIKSNSDLRFVWVNFMIWLLSDPKKGMLRLCKNDGVLAIEKVLDLYKRVLIGDIPSIQESVETADFANSVCKNVSKTREVMGINTAKHAALEFVNLDINNTLFSASDALNPRSSKPYIQFANQLLKLIKQA
jgi:hypothetical protein